MLQGTEQIQEFIGIEDLDRNGAFQLFHAEWRGQNSGVKDRGKHGLARFSLPEQSDMVFRCLYQQSD